MSYHPSLGQDYAIAREVRGFGDSEFWERAVAAYLAENPLSDRERDEYARMAAESDLEGKLEAVRSYEADPSTMDLWCVLDLTGGVFRWRRSVSRGAPRRC